MTGKLLHAATLPIELNNGNDGRGSKWFSSASLRKRYEEILILDGHRREPFVVPVRLRVTRLIGKGQRAWDADSVLRGSAKELIDALVAVGWFRDDGPRYITSVVGDQDDRDRANGPAVRVEVYEA